MTRTHRKLKTYEIAALSLWKIRLHPDIRSSRSDDFLQHRRDSDWSHFPVFWVCSRHHNYIPGHSAARPPAAQMLAGTKPRSPAYDDPACDFPRREATARSFFNRFRLFRGTSDRMSFIWQESAAAESAMDVDCRGKWY